MATDKGKRRRRLRENDIKHSSKNIFESFNS
jgi:hypothetical protein